MYYKTVLFAYFLLQIQADISLAPDSRAFLDEFGRTRIFHGFNVVVKDDPYLPTRQSFDAIMSLTDNEIKQMAEWGVKLVRLGVLWEAVEPSKGSYDDAFLDDVEELINKLGESGIYTLIDSHQDLLSRQFCGEGVPYFYLDGYETECPDTDLGNLYE